MMREVSTKLTMHRNGTFSISGCIMLKKVWPFGFLWHESFTRLLAEFSLINNYSRIMEMILMKQTLLCSVNMNQEALIRRPPLLSDDSGCHTHQICVILPVVSGRTTVVVWCDVTPVMWRWCWSRVTLSLTGATWEHRLHIWCHVAAQRDSVQVRSKGCWV